MLVVQLPRLNWENHPILLKKNFSDHLLGWVIFAAGCSDPCIWIFLLTLSGEVSSLNYKYDSYTEPLAH